VQTDRLALIGVGIGSNPCTCWVWRYPNGLPSVHLVGEPFTCPTCCTVSWPFR